MFLVACNPDYQQIRHLVITGFSELGNSIEELQQETSDTQQRIKETAVYGKYECYKENAEHVINILLSFCASN